MLKVIQISDFPSKKKKSLHCLDFLQIFLNANQPHCVEPNTSLEHQSLGLTMESKSWITLLCVV